MKNTKTEETKGYWTPATKYNTPYFTYHDGAHEHGLEFSYVVDKYPNFKPVLGNDLELANWPKELDLGKTDLIFIDAEHTPEQLQKELDLYMPLIPKDCVILIDDIHSFGLETLWADFKKGKWGEVDAYDATHLLHYSGFGVARKL